MEDRTVRPSATPAAAQPPAAAASAALSSQDHTPGYTVKPGDTLIRISLDTGTRLSDLARWNNIENPDRIEVGQVLRITPPASETGPATRPAPPSKLEVKPLPPAGAASGGAAVTTTTTTTTTAGPAAPVNAAPVASSPAAAEGELQWAWPAAGAVTAPFDEGRNKGVNIAGKAGDPVYAAADGQVVYAGSGLYGYGNLVIVKHNNTYLTAYAFNRALLVKEDQMVRRGQKIAEMGSTGSTDRVQLHFEIRKMGKPIDPTALLPGR